MFTAMGLPGPTPGVEPPPVPIQDPGTPMPDRGPQPYPVDDPPYPEPTGPDVVPTPDPTKVV